MDPIEAIFGRNSRVEIYGGEFRSVVGSYTQHTDIEEINVSDSSNLTHITIKESVDDDGEGAGDRLSTGQSNDSACGEEQLLGDESQKRHKQPQVAMHNPLFNLSPPVGLTPKAKNLYQLLMVSANGDHQRHGSSTLLNARTNIPTLNGYPPVNTALTSSQFETTASGIQPNFGAPLCIPNLDTPDIINGKLQEDIHTSTTTNNNSGTVFNASAKSNTSISFTGLHH
ncbi:hypothetical protein BJ165DRAFT_1450623 [Panaeolus papilionaceus]|nr:hypothetical protein BJ165DRAFT_1450623 [Panaeolus papilionaceus]